MCACVCRAWVACGCVRVCVLRVGIRGRGVWGKCAGLAVMVWEDGGARLLVGGGEGGLTLVFGGQISAGTSPVGLVTSCERGSHIWLAGRSVFLVGGADVAMLAIAASLLAKL